MYHYIEGADSIQNVSTDEEKYEHFMQRINNGEKVEANDWMPDDYRTALIRLISMHGVSEIMGALPEKEWTPKAPSLKRKLAIMAKVQDEMGHGQLLLRVAEDLQKPFGTTRKEVMEDLLIGKIKFHNVFHMKTKSWADAAIIAWLVDGAAIITQTNMLNASYGPYQRALQRICAEEVFHAQHGEALVMALANGTKEQREMLQEAFSRWWDSLIMFFGPPSPKVTGSSRQDIMIKYKIRINTNEELRQAFFDKYIPRVKALGLEIPDKTLTFNEDTKEWTYAQPNWDDFKQIINNHGPRSKARLRLREIAHENSRWVRRALAEEEAVV
ncbi:1,2-phenylacetyl-CoA epoxidase subunit PaaA [Pseudogracilibacillus auburnensis]|uniref:1,2-phenylacetyl-CoA epoxidase subunit PaaA n=1 Tax=Pseudogracilibacillus auburnensis TaxID=1494959 RepID=UPI001A9674D0|nr:1,2-phenylacetyl-CoA epoxidase subunit PaaA [Pseudogracilibacillus auburnensis]MBO1005672.1 1,2-phenylacetyl-CoA epoxidase subunit A [Pseudogracilibacillus auburnensis]